MNVQLYVLCILLGISPASDCGLLTFWNPLSVPSSRAGYKEGSILYTLHPALEDGTDRGFRNVGKPQSDAGEIPKRIHTIFKTRRKFGSFNIMSTHIRWISATSIRKWTYVCVRDTRNFHVTWQSVIPLAFCVPFIFTSPHSLRLSARCFFFCRYI